MNELILLASITEDGELTVQIPDGANIEAVIAAIIRAACERGCDMGAVFRKLQKLRTRSGKYVSEPLVVQ